MTIKELKLVDHIRWRDYKMKKIIYLCLIAISCLFVASCNKTPKEDFSNMTEEEIKVDLENILNNVDLNKFFCVRYHISFPDESEPSLIIIENTYGS